MLGALEGPHHSLHLVLCLQALLVVGKCDPLVSDGPGYHLAHLDIVMDF